MNIFKFSVINFFLFSLAFPLFCFERDFEVELSNNFLNSVNYVIDNEFTQLEFYFKTPPDTSDINLIKRENNNLLQFEIYNTLLGKSVKKNSLFTFDKNLLQLDFRKNPNSILVEIVFQNDVEYQTTKTPGEKFLLLTFKKKVTAISETGREVRKNLILTDEQHLNEKAQIVNAEPQLKEKIDQIKAEEPVHPEMKEVSGKEQLMAPKNKEYKVLVFQKTPEKSDHKYLRYLSYGLIGVGGGCLGFSFYAKYVSNRAFEDFKDSPDNSELEASLEDKTFRYDRYFRTLVIPSGLVFLAGSFLFYMLQPDLEVAGTINERDSFFSLSFLSDNYTVFAFSRKF